MNTMNILPIINAILVLLIVVINVIDPKRIKGSRNTAKKGMEKHVMKKYRRLVTPVLIHALIACVLVIAYSPGYLALRPSDPSIFKAGMSILTIPACILALIATDWTLLRKPKPVYVKPDNIIRAEQVKETLQNCIPGNNTPFAIKRIDILEDQLERIRQSRERTMSTIKSRFESGSYTFERYESIINDAYRHMLKTIVVIANHLSVYDENKYIKLKKEYRYDDIPDDIQEEQLALYEKMRNQIEEGIATNERVIVRMDKLSLELISTESEIQSSDQLVAQIEELTTQLKYYE